MGKRLLSCQRNDGWRRVVGVCCVLLVLLAASAELSHAHISGGIHPDCSLCVTAHSAAQATVATTAALVLHHVARCADPEPIYTRRSLDIRLSIRPPPALPLFA
jgi:hypothetical protein